jgi:hypothetical protein
LQTLLTIDDLQKDGWQSLLPNVAWLGDLYEEFKKNDSIFRTITATMGGSEGRAAGIHASEISGCARKVVYSLLGEEKKDNVEGADTNMRRRMQQGHMLHALTQDDFDRMCWMTNGTLEFRPELEIRPDLYPVAEKYNIYSHCDGAFTYFANHQPYLRVGLEIKTMSDPEYAKLKKPLDYHVEQAHVYMKVLDLPLMWFFYYNKSNSNWTQPKPPFLIAFDHRIWNQLENRIIHARSLAEAKTLPERQEEMPCRWCPFSWTCMPTILQKRKSNSRKGPPRPGEFGR